MTSLEHDNDDAEYADWIDSDDEEEVTPDMERSVMITEGSSSIASGTDDDKEDARRRRIARFVSLFDGEKRFKGWKEMTAYDKAHYGFELKAFVTRCRLTHLQTVRLVNVVRSFAATAATLDGGVRGVVKELERTVDKWKEDERYLIPVRCSDETKLSCASTRTHTHTHRRMRLLSIDEREIVHTLFTHSRSTHTHALSTGTRK